MKKLYRVAAGWGKRANRVMGKSKVNRTPGLTVNGEKNEINSEVFENRAVKRRRNVGRQLTGEGRMIIRKKRPRPYYIADVRCTLYRGRRRRDTAYVGRVSYIRRAYVLYAFESRNTGGR